MRKLHVVAYSGCSVRGSLASRICRWKHTHSARCVIRALLPWATSLSASWVFGLMMSHALKVSGLHSGMRGADLVRNVLVLDPNLRSAVATGPNLSSAVGAGVGGLPPRPDVRGPAQSRLESGGEAGLSTAIPCGTARLPGNLGPLDLGRRDSSCALRIPTDFLLQHVSPLHSLCA